MTYSVFIQAPAEADILACWRHISEDAPLNADRWRDALFEAILSLRQMPQRHPRVKLKGLARLEIRYIPFDSHRVYYLIDHRNIRVLSVHHAARRQPSVRKLRDTMGR